MTTTQASALGEIRRRVREFILRQFPLAGRQGLRDADSLLESGIVDSMGILEVVGFLEQAFGIELSDEDLLADTFESIDSLAQFVAERSRVVGVED